MGNIDVDICIVTTIHGDFDNRIYQRQLSTLVDEGWSVCMVAPWDFGKRNRRDFEFVRTPRPGNRFSRIRHGFRTYRAAKRVDARLYIFHDPDFILFGALLKLTTGRKVIYDCHENIPEDILYGKDWIPSFLRRPISASFRLIEDSVAKYLGYAIVVVPHLLRRFEATGVATVLVRNLANFVVSDEFRNEHAVLYSGSMSRDYGAYNLLAIAREIKARGRKIPMRIVDRFVMQDALRDEFFNAVENEDLDIEFLPQVEAANMSEILTMGSIGLSPLLNTVNKALAYPTKIFEYFAFGLAVIATDTVSTREILEDGRLGFLLDDHDHLAWVDAVEKLYFDDEFRAKYRDLGRRAFAAGYNWDAEKRTLVQFVKNCIEDTN